jgi:hypothetical protein
MRKERETLFIICSLFTFLFSTFSFLFYIPLFVVYNLVVGVFGVFGTGSHGAAVTAAG